jgi:nucleoside-diphosphate-sugar epimerase
MPETVAITGATGFIGTSLLQQLLTKNFQVRALTRRTQREVKGVEWVQGDLSNIQSLNDLTKGVDYVIHCAGQVRGRSLDDFLVGNCEGTLNLVKSAASQSKSPRILMISSLAAREPELSWYSKSKRRGEEVLINNAANMKWSIFRPSAVYGPGDKELAPLLKMTRSGVLPISGNPDSRFGLIYVDDLVNAIITWIETEVPGNEIYELDDGTDGGYDSQLVREIARKVWGHPVYIISVPVLLLRLFAIINLGLSRVLRYLPMLTPGKVRELLHNNWVCDLDLISRDLGWHPRISLAEGLPKLISVDTH